jgi:hypothetical protein
MEQLNKVPAIQPPRREGVSKRAVLIIVLLLAIFYVANWISTRPLTRQSRFVVTPTHAVTNRPAPPAAGAPAEAAAAGRWCRDFGGVFERFSPYVEICYFLTFQNQSSSSSSKRR